MRLLDDLIGRLLGWAVQADSGFWMPVQGSTGAVVVDRIFSLILWVSVFFFVLIVFLMILFVVRYRRRAGREEAEPSPRHNTALEVTWTVIPVLIVIVIFVWGFKAFLNLNVPPANAYEVLVTGQKSGYNFAWFGGAVAVAATPAGCTTAGFLDMFSATATPVGLSQGTATYCNDASNVIQYVNPAPGALVPVAIVTVAASGCPAGLTALGN